MNTAGVDSLNSVSGVLDWMRKLVDFGGREARLSYLVVVIESAVLAATLSTAYVAWRLFTGDLLDSPISGFLSEAQELFLTARLWGFVAFLALIAAATARRLHDSGRSALPAVVPAALATAAMWAFGRLFTRQSDETDLVAETGGQADDQTIGSTIDSLVDGFRPPRVWDASGGDLAMFGLLTVLTLVAAVPIVLRLVRKGDVEANQFGPPVAE